ncbi:hypothetical protein [Pedobacter sp. P26]|uniref:hypothetical protein n=1 Tax=Pedobacter sp. P26 TaxID=3423956 RepID=UPI003D6744B2
MKHLFNVLTILILAANLTGAQTMDISAKLIENNLINKTQTKEFDAFLKSNEMKSNSGYLYALFQIEYKKLKGKKYSEFSSYLNFSDEKLKPEDQIKTNKDLTVYLSKLKSCSIINEIQFQQFSAKISNNEFSQSLQFLLSITAQAAFQEHMSPEKLKVFANKLKSKEIVSVKYDQLISDIDKRQLQNPIDFLNYCNKAVIINEHDYANEPEKYLEQIHKKTASIFPELAFTDFQFRVVLDSTISDDESKFYDFIVSLKSNGKKYKQKTFFRLYRQTKDQYFGDKIDQQEYYNIFNKILADLQSPYRLHEVKANQGDAMKEKVFGIIALSKEQANSLRSDDDYFSPSYESFKNTLTSKNITNAIGEYKKIGLFSHLTAAQIEKAKETVSEQQNINLNDVLMAFPEVIYRFDTELANLEAPYDELIKEYQKISHQDFNPTEVSDNFDIEKNKEVVLRFKLGAKLYKETFKIENDWIDPKFFDFIKAVVTENKLKGQFYELYTGGQEAGIIYLKKNNTNI